MFSTQDTQYVYTHTQHYTSYIIIPKKYDYSKDATKKTKTKKEEKQLKLLSQKNKRKTKNEDHLITPLNKHTYVLIYSMFRT